MRQGRRRSRKVHRGGYVRVCGSRRLEGTHAEAQRRRGFRVRSAKAWRHPEGGERETKSLRPRGRASNSRVFPDAASAFAPCGASADRSRLLDCFAPLAMMALLGIAVVAQVATPPRKIRACSTFSTLPQGEGGGLTAKPVPKFFRQCASFLIFDGLCIPTQNNIVVFPSGFYVQMKMKYVLTGGGTIGLNQIDAFAS